MRYKLLLAAAALALSVNSFAQADIESLINNMSRKEKIAQLIVECIDTQSPDSLKKVQDKLVVDGIGGVIVMDDDLAKNMELINHMQSLAKIPLLVTIDGEWGASMRYREYAQFPRAMQLGALTDRRVVYSVGKAIGEELKELNILANFAPVVDINNNANNPVINTRSFGEDRDKVAEFGSAFMQGMQKAGVAGSAKHFPGHGDTDVDSHKGLPILTFNRHRLDSLELYPFRKLIADGVEMVMVGHLSVPALDPTGTAASISKPISTDLLRNELGFKGIIITDALGMKGVAANGVDASVAAYAAGADILLMPNNAKATIDDLDKAFQEGRFSEAELNEKVRKVLSLKDRYGMLDPKFNRYVEISSLPFRSQRPLTEALIQDISDRTMTPVVGHKYLGKIFKKNKKTAYVAFNAISKESGQFERELAKFGKFDRFDLKADATDAAIDSVGKLIAGYDNVIVCFHSGKPRPSSGGPKRFAYVEAKQFDKIAAWSETHNLYGVYLGNPYDLNKLPKHKLFKSFVIGYSDTRHNNIAAARAIGDGMISGVLPVSAGGYPCGYNSKNNMKVK